jgi:hypothetical protein
MRGSVCVWGGDGWRHILLIVCTRMNGGSVETRHRYMFCQGICTAEDDYEHIYGLPFSRITIPYGTFRGGPSLTTVCNAEYTSNQCNLVPSTVQAIDDIHDYVVHQHP